MVAVSVVVGGAVAGAVGATVVVVDFFELPPQAANTSAQMAHRHESAKRVTGETFAMNGATCQPMSTGVLGAGR